MVTLRGGRKLAGEIELAEFGVVDGVGIGSKLPDGGFINLDIGGLDTEVPAADIRSVEATWVDRGLGGQSDWKIDSLRIVTRDGRELNGRPTWAVHATTVRIRPPGADRAIRIHAFPLGRMFKAENLLERVEITGR